MDGHLDKITQQMIGGLGTSGSPMAKLLREQRSEGPVLLTLPAYLRDLAGCGGVYLMIQ